MESLQCFGRNGNGIPALQEGEQAEEEVHWDPHVLGTPPSDKEEIIPIRIRRKVENIMIKRAMFQLQFSVELRRMNSVPKVLISFAMSLRFQEMISE